MFNSAKKTLLTVLLCCILTGCGSTPDSASSASNNSTLPTSTASQTAAIIPTANKPPAKEVPAAAPALSRLPATLASGDNAEDTTSAPDGEVTILAHSVDSGNTYTLRADVSSGEVERLYFPNGGSIGFTSSDIDRTGDGSGTDTEGRQWFFQGFADGTASTAMDEDTDKEDTEN